MLFETSVFVAVLVVVLYSWWTKNRNFWKNQGIDELESSIVFGNVKDAVLLRKSIGQVYTELYSQSDKPAVGVFEFRKPHLLIRDSELARIFLISEFSSFTDNAYYTEPSDFFNSKHPFWKKGNDWKNSRGLSAPALTLNKTKNYVPQLVAVAQELVNYVENNIEKPYEVFTTSHKYSTDTCMSIVFGLHSNAISDPNSPYLTVFKSVFVPDFWSNITFRISQFFPDIGRFFKIKMTPQSFVDFFTGITKTAVDYRNSNQVKRNDYLQHLIDNNGKDGKAEMSVYDMTACCMTILADGIDTTAIAISHFLDLLSRHPHVQDQIRNELKQCCKSVEELTYDSINSLKYLNAAFWESLRFRTAVPILKKLCTRDIEIKYKNHSYKMKKGDIFVLPIEGIHMNPKYFPEPDKYKPERFLDHFDDSAVFAFGLGPRSCMGKLLGTMQIKVIVAALLFNYKIIPEKPNQPIIFDEKSTFLNTLKYNYNVFFKKL